MRTKAKLVTGLLAVAAIGATATTLATAGVVEAEHLGAPPLTGKEQPLLTRNVNGLVLGEKYEADPGVSVMIKSLDEKSICFDVAIPDNATFSGCDEMATLATGLSHVALYDGHSHTLDVVGIVPDEVVAVEVDGKLINVDRNVWHYRTTKNRSIGSIAVLTSEGEVQRLESAPA